MLASPSPTLLARWGKMIVINRLRPPKAVLIVITTLANGSIIFIHSDVLHPRLNYLPIFKLIAKNSAHTSINFNRIMINLSNHFSSIIIQISLSL